MQQPSSQGSDVDTVPQRPTGGWWTIPLMTLGLSLIACALIIGQVEENRQMAWQKHKLEEDLQYLRDQAAKNQTFLDGLNSNAELVERLAQRQMKLVREGAAVLELKGLAIDDNTSAFKLTNLPPATTFKPYQPAPGLMTRLFGDEKTRLWAYGLGAMLVAAGLILGGDEPKQVEKKPQLT